MRPALAIWLSRILLAAVATMLALAASEVMVRLRGFDPHPATKYRFHPRYGWTMDPSFWRLDNLQPSGFRTPEEGQHTATGPRVLVLGDSFTVAVEHRWADTFAGILAADLEARGGVLNSLSSGGWGTAQEYLALLDEGLAWDPDVVILQVFPFNDLCNNGLLLAHTCSWQDHLRPYFTLQADRLEQTWMQPLRGRLRSSSRLFGVVDRFDWWRRLGSPGESRAEFRRRTTEFTRGNARRIGLEHEGQVYSLFPDAVQPDPVRQAWAVTEALFAAIHGELDRRGVPLLAVVIPFNKTLAPEWRAYRRQRPKVMQADYGTRRSEEIFTGLGVPLVSVRRRIQAQQLDGGELFNRFNHHLSVEGHRWTARWILEELAATSR